MWIILVIMVFLLFILIFVKIIDDSDIRIFIVSSLLSGIFLFATLFVYSDDMVNYIIKNYEKGYYEKEVTIKGSDTTYKWVNKSIK